MKRRLLPVLSCALAACAAPARKDPGPDLELRLVAESGGWPLPSWDGPEKVNLEREILFSGGDFESVTPSSGGDSGKEPALWLRFTPVAAARFAQETARDAGRRLAVVIAGKVASAPKILHPIDGGVFEITGASDEKVRAMARAAYRLPAP